MKHPERRRFQNLALRLAVTATLDDVRALAALDPPATLIALSQVRDALHDWINNRVEGSAL